ncbi:MAG: hypothetical protein U0791_26795 [Gemmataceae bacterium]
MALLGTEFRETGKPNMPKRCFTDRPHTHKALGQSELFCNMLADRRRQS